MYACTVARVTFGTRIRSRRRPTRRLTHALLCDAAATLVHAFVTSRLDHCCSVLVGLPLTLTAYLDKVLHSAVRLIGGSVPKYAFISRYMCDTLHWLPIQQRIFYRVAVLLWHCLLGIAGTLSPCIDPGWLPSASFLFWWQTLSPCKHLDCAALCILSCCSFYLEFSFLTDSIVTKEQGWQKSRFLEKNQKIGFL